MSKSKSKPPRSPKPPSTRQSQFQPVALSGSDNGKISAEHVFLLLLAYRILNALTVKTFFQPDEYYQSLEPAWRLAFGAESGAWITWEWKNQLRSSLHPILFAGVYQAAALLSKILNFGPTRRAAVLLAAPKVTQAVFAASLDFFTWRFAQRIYGSQSSAAWATLALTLLSPWQWFCSTRTLSNSIEAALTSAAFFFWPWHWILARAAQDSLDKHRLRRVNSSLSPLKSFGEVARLRASLLLAAVASILRPTNILIWIPLSLQSLRNASSRERQALVTEAIRCGSLIAASTALLDRWFYGLWTFPPVRFLHFNITRDLAVFYGTNRPDYYVTEGLPLLLMAGLPFVVIALYSGMSSTLGLGNLSSQGRSIESVTRTLSWVVVFMVGSLSFVSHKEARFVYPLLPPLFALAGLPVSKALRHMTVWKYAILLVVLAFNIGASFYTTQIHQRGVIDVLDYLRSQHEQSLLDPNGAKTTVGFMMPCHSTPWRSHLIYPEIDAWALTCEPPIDLALQGQTRVQYADEADVFYSAPINWLRASMEDVKWRFHDGVGDGPVAKANYEAQQRNTDGRVVGVKRSWPKYIVAFQALETTLHVYLKRAPYIVCWRGFNTQQHDDARRMGDVIVWCLPS